MYFISREEDLRGKKVAFTHFAQFAKAITIVTEDGGILVCDKDEEEIKIFREPYARKYILNHQYLRTELNKLKLITDEEINKYEEELKEKYRKEHELREKQKEEYEYKEYLRLKEKFETK